MFFIDHSSFSVGLALFCAPLCCQAMPTLSTSFVQDGGDCAFSWSINDAPQPNGGAAIYIEGVASGHDTGNFLGWYRADQGVINGTIADGWTDYPPNGVDDSVGYVPRFSDRYTGIFSVGTHAVEVQLYLTPDDAPQSFTPDGPGGGGKQPGVPLSFSTSFEVKAVPESFSVAFGFGASALLILAAARLVKSGVS